MAARAPKFDARRNYYRQFGLSSNATAEEIKKRWKELVLLNHPDKHPGEEAIYNQKFQALGHAYEILSSPELRAEYDKVRHRQRGPSQTLFTGPQNPLYQPSAPNSNASAPRYAAPNPAKAAPRYDPTHFTKNANAPGFSTARTAPSNTEPTPLFPPNEKLAYTMNGITNNRRSEPGNAFGHIPETRLPGYTRGRGGPLVGDDSAQNSDSGGISPTSSHRSFGSTKSTESLRSTKSNRSTGSGMFPMGDIDNTSW